MNKKKKITTSCSFNARDESDYIYVCAPHCKLGIASCELERYRWVCNYKRAAKVGRKCGLRRE